MGEQGCSWEGGLSPTFMVRVGRRLVVWMDSQYLGITSSLVGMSTAPPAPARACIQAAGCEQG